MKFFTNRYSHVLDMFTRAYRPKPNRSPRHTKPISTGKKNDTNGFEDLLGLPMRPTNKSVRFLRIVKSIRSITNTSSKEFVNLSGFLLLIFISLLFTSCQKEEKTQLAPSLQLIKTAGSISSDTTIAFGDLMNFTLKATSGSENLTNLYALRSGIGLVETRALDTSMNTFSFQVNKSFTKNLADNEYWTFVVRDKNRLADSVSLKISRDTAADFGPIRSIESLVMSAQNQEEPGSFYDFETGVMPLAQALQQQESIDLLYYYYGEDENVIASPGANVEDGVFEGNLQNWDIRRTTRFIPLDISAEDFYAANNDSLLVVSYIEGTGKRKAKNLTAGDLFSFKTQDARFGIFRVSEIEGTDAGTVVIDYKVQDK